MKRKIAVLVCALTISVSMLTGCGNSAPAASETSEAKSEAAEEETVAESSTAASEESEDPAAQPFVPALEDGVYTAEVDTDSSMFHINEACEGTCTLVVQDGAMTAHLILGGTGIINLYQGTKEEAQEDGAVLIEPIEETVTYSDGMTEDVYAFDVPVPVLDEEFPVAIIGDHGKWYDHTVIISNPVLEE